MSPILMTMVTFGGKKNYYVTLEVNYQTDWVLMLSKHQTETPKPLKANFLDRPTLDKAVDIIANQEIDEREEVQSHFILT